MRDAPAKVTIMQDHNFIIGTCPVLRAGALYPRRERRGFTARRGNCVADFFRNGRILREKRRIGCGISKIKIGTTTDSFDFSKHRVRHIRFSFRKYRHRTLSLLVLSERCLSAVLRTGMRTIRRAKQPAKKERPRLSKSGPFSHCPMRNSKLQVQFPTKATRRFAYVS